MHNSRKGFTLAEVLVTLAIIGVVAALTIPTLISSTNSQKFTTGLKKNLSMLSSVVQTNLANNGLGAEDTNIVDSEDLARWFMSGNTAGTSATTMNVLKWDQSSAANSVNAWLADGTRLTFVKVAGGSNGCSAASVADPGNFSPAAGACYVFVDVNGDKAPNSISTSGASGVVSDAYVLGIGGSSVVPVRVAAAITLPTLNDISGAAIATYSGGTIASGNSSSYNAMAGGTT